MVAIHLSVLSRLTQLCWLVLPSIVFFSVIIGLYFHQQPLIDSWLVNLWWLGYVSIAIAALIAWQFGRSRLVYACFFMLLLFANPGNIVATAVLDSVFIGVLVCLVYLMFSQDKGFSVPSLIFSMLVFAVIFVLAYWWLPLLQNNSQSWLSALDSQLFSRWPTLRSVLTPFQFLLLICVVLLALVRLGFKTDNSHNALFFVIVLSIFIYLLSLENLRLVGLFSLSTLICFAVLKDSFTMAFKDELTGIPSRRSLMQHVQGLGRKYTVVMSDIDHFKKFNDTYGHDVGDEVLKLVASKLSKVLGGGKTFRYGGEEFIMLFPRKTAKEVAPYVEMVRQTIADYDIALRAKPRPPKPKKAAAKKPAKDKIVKVTTSFGIAERTKQHPEFNDIMKQADVALYAAKKAGRNCVKIAKQ